MLEPMIRSICLAGAFVLLAGGLPARAAPAKSFASYPLFLAPPLVPNVLVLLDNSGSMDATMAGKVISGDDPNTRSNIARTVLRQVITNNRAAFNWGLGTFELSGSPVLWNTQAYFLGSNATMVYTNDCRSVDPAAGDANVPLSAVPDTVGYSPDGPQVSVPGNPVYPFKTNCVLNPDRTSAGLPRNGMNYLTFERSGDDVEINDVYYTPSTSPFMFGIGVVGATSPNSYNIYTQRDATTAWTPANFVKESCLFCPIDFTPTDAGFLPVAANLQRMLFVKRGWGYGNGITGLGRLVEPVLSSETGTSSQRAAEAAHYGALMNALAPETYVASTEIKNGAFSTPLAGSLRTAGDYFAGGLRSAKSPITQACQSNYVVLATDGNPTAKPDGTRYDPPQWVNTQNADGSWTFGQAQMDAFAQVGTVNSRGKGTGGLRQVTLASGNLSNAALAGTRVDVQTYVIGLGETNANAGSVATLNEMARLGGGRPSGAFIGSSAERVQDAFQRIVGSIKAKLGGASSVAVNTSLLTGSSAVYQATFNSGDWSGDLKAFAVDPKTGTLAASPLWSASDQLKAQDWDSGRSILTAKASAAVGARGIAFRWPADPAAPTANELDVAQSSALNTSAAGVLDNQGALRLQYLRGDRSREASKCASCTPSFRDRGSPLGDLIDSTPVLVGAPSGSFYDDIESEAYASFVTARRLRTKLLYVGSNDGMLHGFDAATGAEMLAYVPSPLIAPLSQLTDLGYQHRYYADGTPTVGDAFYGGRWHSLLVSGMRAGAKGVFALDVTDPSVFSEASAQSVVRWEFLNSQDADMGFLFSQPVIVKTNNGRWSVIVANGYNAGSNAGSASGHAVLFVLDAETGAVVRKIDTGAGSAASPNGLSGPAVVDTNGDGIADVVYAGDLNGNLWKFDLSPATAAGWGVGNGGLPLFNTDENNPAAGTRPITGRPNVTQFPRGGYMVVFGSGSYLSSADVSSTTTQALYGIWDSGTAPGSTVAQASLMRQTVAGTDTGPDGALYRLTTHAVGSSTNGIVAGDGVVSLQQYYGTLRGWYLELPSAGERSVADPRLRGGRAIFSSLIPNVANPCDYGGNGWLMELDVVTGNRDDRGTFDTDNSSGIDASDRLSFNTRTPNTASGRFFSGIPASPTTVGTGDIDTQANAAPSKKSCTEIRYVPKSDGTTERVVVACGNASVGRAQWRELR